MKKLNLICASIATLFAVGAANAGTTVSTATKIAVENFGGSAAVQETLTVLGAPISYNMSSITAVNSGSTVYFTVRLTGGKFTGTPSATNFTFGGQSCIAGVASPSNPNCVVSPSSDRSTIKIAITTGTSYTLGLGAFTWTPAVGGTEINAVNTTLATVGGKVSASIGLVTLDPGTAFNSTDTQVTIDTPLALGDLAVGSRAIANFVGGAILTVPPFGYTGKIDLTVPGAASSDFTTPGYAVLGSYKFTNTPSSGKQLAGATDYMLAAGSVAGANTGASVTVTPSATQSFPVGSVLTLHSNAICTAALVGSGNTATVTAGNAATAKTMVTTGVVVSGTEYFVCITKPVAPNLATPIQVTVAATVTAAATNDLIAPTAALGYNLGNNGSVVDLNAYWPGALAQYNYLGYVRVINTGIVAAQISAAHINPVTGVAGSSFVLPINQFGFTNNMLPAGANVMLSTVQIDNVLGAGPSGVTAGRIRITAPTNALKAQSFLQTNNTAPVEYSGAQLQQ